MAIDALLGPLASSAVITATYTGSWVDLTTKPGTPRMGMVARVTMQAHSASNAANTATFGLQWSPDQTQSANLVSQIGFDGSTPFTPGASVSPYPQIDLPFVMPTGARWARLNVVLSGTTSQPSMTVDAYFEDAWVGG